MIGAHTAPHARPSVRPGTRAAGLQMGTHILAPPAAQVWAGPGMCRQRNSTWDATGADPARIDKGSGTQEGAGRGRRDGKPGLGARMWREFAGAPSGISSCGACSGGLRPGGHYPCKSVQPHRRLARSTADGGAPELGREDDSLLFRAAQRRPAPPPCRLARDASGRAGVDVAAGGVGVAAAGTPTRRLPGRRGRAATAGRRALQLLVASSCCSILSLSAPSAPALPRACTRALTPRPAPGPGC